MKKTLTLLMLGFISIIGISQQSYLNIYEKDKTFFFTNISEGFDNSYLLTSHYDSNNNENNIDHNFYDIITQIDESGNKINEYNTSDYFQSALKNIIKHDTSYYAIGYCRESESSKLCLLWMQLNKNLELINSKITPINNDTYIVFEHADVDSKNNFIAPLTTFSETEEHGYVYKISVINGNITSMIEHNSDQIGFYPRIIIESQRNTYYSLVSDFTGVSELNDNMVEVNYFMQTNVQPNDNLNRKTFNGKFINDSTIFIVGHYDEINKTFFTITDSTIRHKKEIIMDEEIEIGNYPAMTTSISADDAFVYSSYSENHWNSTSLSKISQKIVVVKFDHNLNLIWKRHIGNGENITTIANLITNDGGCIVVGRYYDWENDEDGSIDGFILKLDADGNLLWQQELSTPMASIYPNPGREYFEIEQTENVNSVELYNMSGVMVLTHEVDNNSNRIDTSELPSGLYIYKVKDDNGSLSYQGKWMKE